jgi:hypothetical protein
MDSRVDFFKGDEKKFFIFGLLPSVMLISITILYITNTRDNEFKKDLLNENFIYNVEKIYNDKSNHNSPTILTTKGESIRNIYNAQQKDSIVKNEKDSFVYIYRNDTIIQLNLLNMYRETGWYED